MDPKRRTFLTINRADHWQRGFFAGFVPAGDRLLLAPDRSLFSGVFYSAALDSGENDFCWRRVRLFGELEDEALLRVSLYAANTKLLDADEADIDQYLRSPYVNDAVKASALDRLFGEAHRNTTDFLAEVTGRYLWLRVELISTGMGRSTLREIQVQTGGDHMLDYLPELYSREDPEGFTRRFVSIFDSMVLDLEETIYAVGEKLDLDRAEGDMLRYLASWLCIEEDDLSDAQLRQRMRGAFAEYQSAQTPKGIADAIERELGVRPILVEHFNVDSAIRSGKDRAVYKRLFGENPYRFFVLLPEGAFSSRGRADAFLERLQKRVPAHIEARLVLLKDGVYLDWNTYMGINTRISDYKAVSMDESAGLDYNTVLGGPKDKASKEREPAPASAEAKEGGQP